MQNQQEAVRLQKKYRNNIGCSLFLIAAGLYRAFVNRSYHLNAFAVLSLVLGVIFFVLCIAWNVKKLNNIQIEDSPEDMPSNEQV